MKRLKAKTPKGAAKEFAAYLTKTYPEIVGNHLIVKENEVIWEEGPYEWVHITAGSIIFAGESGNYSEQSPDWPEGISNKHVFAEPINHYSIAFHEK